MSSNDNSNTLLLVLFFYNILALLFTVKYMPMYFEIISAVIVMVLMIYLMVKLLKKLEKITGNHFKYYWNEASLSYKIKTGLLQIFITTIALTAYSGIAYVLADIAFTNVDEMMYFPLIMLFVTPFFFFLISFLMSLFMFFLGLLEEVFPNIK